MYASSDPIILAFDTSRAACDFALLRGQNLLGHRCEEMAKGQAERLLSLCHEVMDEAGITPADLSAIGVGIGPGNFTGIRISASAARGLALGLGIPAIGVSAFDALSYGSPTPCTTCVDARRDQVYVQSFTGDGPHPPRIMPKSELSGITPPLIGADMTTPRYPAAVAIAHVARMRMTTPQPRPAPLYLRPADAAPARDAPPKMLS